MLHGRLLDNSKVITLGSVLVGAGMGLNLMGSYAFLLSTINPIYFTYIMGISGIALIIFLHFFDLKKMKFAKFGVISTLFVVAVLWLLTFDFWSDKYKALFWLFTGTFGLMYFKWAMGELSLRHLNPATAQIQFAYTSMGYEIGTLLAIGGVGYYYPSAEPSTFIYITMALYFVFALLMLVFLCPKHNLEIYFKSHITMDERDLLEHSKTFRNASVFIIGLIFLFGAYEALIDYLFNTVVQNELSSYDEIVKLISKVFMISSAIVIFLSMVTGKVVQAIRLSPIHIYFIHLLIPLAALIACVANPSLFSFTVLAVLLLVSIKSFNSTAEQMILASFPEKERNILTSLQHFGYWVIPNFLIAALFSFAKDLSFETLTNIQIYLTFGVAFAILVLLVFVNFVLIKTFYKYIRSRDKSTAILAAQGLSYLNPKDYCPKMIEILKKNPQKLLRKTVIAGLGYRGQEDVMEVVANEFDSDNEEVQISVLEALEKAKIFFGIEFIIEVLIGKQVSSTINVRTNAAKILAALYGKKAIPILLYGLHDEDQRIQANSLETLSMFNEKSLIYHFKPYVKSDVSRLRANALMGLSRYKVERKFYREETLKMLHSRDENNVASITYAIGKVKDRAFIPELVKLSRTHFEEKPMIRRCLTFALASFRHPLGFELFDEFFTQKKKDKFQSDFIHFFAQLDYRLRFDLIEYMLQHHHNNKAFARNLIKHLKYSHIDFHNELNFVEQTLENI